MFNRIKALFEGGSSSGAKGSEDVGLAVAALLVEAAHMDGTFDDDERGVIERLLKERFSLAQDEADALIAEAQKAVDRSSQLYGFTRTIKDEFSFEQRVEMVEMLWETVYADGTLHDFEANMMRRICGLIHVPDRDSGIARKKAKSRLGLID